MRECDVLMEKGVMGLWFLGNLGGCWSITEPSTVGEVMRSGK